MLRTWQDESSMNRPLRDIRQQFMSTLGEMDRLMGGPSTMEPWGGEIGRPQMMGEISRPLVSGMPMDVIDHPDRIVLKADLPGFRKGEFSMDVENDVLTISGERQRSRDEEGEGWKVRERAWGKVNRSFALPQNVDQDRIDAVHRDGVLCVTLPKKQTTPMTTKKGKNIPIH